MPKVIRLDDLEAAATLLFLGSKKSWEEFGKSFKQQNPSLSQFVPGIRTPNEVQPAKVEAKQNTTINDSTKQSTSKGVQATTTGPAKAVKEESVPKKVTSQKTETKENVAMKTEAAETKENIPMATESARKFDRSTTKRKRKRSKHLTLKPRNVKTADVSAVKKKPSKASNKFGKKKKRIETESLEAKFVVERAGQVSLGPLRRVGVCLLAENRKKEMKKKVRRSRTLYISV